MKKIKIEITKDHKSGLKKGVVKSVTSTVAIQLMVTGYAEQVEEEGVKKIDLKQLNQNRAGTSDKAKKLGTLRIGVLASVTKYDRLEAQAKLAKRNSQATPSDEALKERSNKFAEDSKKAFDVMQKLSSKYEALIKEVKGDSIKLPEAPEEIEEAEEVVEETTDEKPEEKSDEKGEEKPEEKSIKDKILDGLGMGKGDDKGAEANPQDNGEVKEDGPTDDKSEKGGVTTKSVTKGD